MNKNKLRIATAFSGIGSPEQAAYRYYGEENVETVFACEIDKFARQSYKAIYGIDDEIFFEDIRKVDGTKFTDKVDIFVWGFPCQDYSVAGKRAGLDGQRGTLFYEGARLVKEMQPDVFIAENVKGLLSSNKGKDFETIMDILRHDVGYYCTYAVLNTKELGVPQNRERVFIVGFKDHGEYMRFEFPETVPLEKKLKDVLEDKVDKKYYLSDTFIKGAEERKERHHRKGNGFAFEPKEAEAIENVNCISCGYGSRATDTYIKVPSPKVVGMLGIKGNEQIRRVYDTDGVSPTPTTMEGGNRQPKILQRARGYNKGGEHKICPTITSCCFDGNNFVQEDNMVLKPNIIRMVRTEEGKKLRKEYESGNVSHRFNEHRKAEVKDDGISNTITSVQKDNHLFEPPYSIRKLTPLECWRLQDFPDEAFYKAQKAGLSNTQLYKQAGNSMSVNVIEKLFRSIEESRNRNIGKSLFCIHAGECSNEQD